MAHTTTPTTSEQLIADAQDFELSETGYTLLDALEMFYLNGLADSVSGDVDAPTGFFYRVDRWIVLTDSQGFTDAYEHATIGAAVSAFNLLETEYVEWEGDDLP